MFLLVLFFFSLQTQTLNISPREADLQFQSAQEDLKQHKVEQAQIEFQNVLQLYEKEKNLSGIADASYYLGKTSKLLSKYPEAIQALNRAIQLHQQLGNRQGEGMDYTELAAIHRRKGEYAETFQFCEKALAIQNAVGDQRGIGRTLDIRAQAHQRQAQYAEATKDLDQALIAARKAGDLEIEGAILSDYGGTHWIQGNYPEALDYYAQALKVAEQIQDIQLQAGIIGNRGLIYWNQGDLAGALEDFKRCGELFKQVGNLGDIGNNDFNIGLVQSNLGNYAEAQEALQSSLKISQQIKDKGLEGVVYEGLGTLHRDLGNYDTALKYLQESERITRQTGEKRATAYAVIGIGTIYEELGDYASALATYQKSYRLYVEMGEKKAIARSLSEIGGIYLEMKNYDRALLNTQAALKMRESIGDRPGVGQSYMMIGATYYRMRKLQEADESLTKSIQVLREIGEPEVLWDALHMEGLTYRDLGKNAEAIQSLEEAVSLIEKVRGEVGLSEQKSAFFEKKLDVYEDLVQLLVKNQNVPLAYEYVQKSKARAFLDSLSEARIDPLANSKPEEYERKKKLESQLTQLNENIRNAYESDPPDMTKIHELSKQRDSTDQQYEELLLEIREQNPRYSDLQYPLPLTLSQVQQLLDPNTVLLDYFVGKTGSFVFVITGGDSQVFPIPADQALNPRVRELLETLQKPEAVWQTTSHVYSRYVKLANGLYKDLIGPAELMMKDKNRIIIASDGLLNYLPFESLLVKEHNSVPIDFSKLSYLTIAYDIQYVPSVSVLSVIQRNASAANHPKTLLAFADPLIESGKKIRPGSIAANDQTFREWSASLPDLPYAKVEVEQISRLYPQEEVTVLYGKEASEKNAKAMNLDQYKILHFASHGLIDEEHPQFSALVLSSDKTGAEDGFLTMREVFGLKLNADLVVLSACKSGLGKQIRGEGVTGLSRAFFCAGTSSVIVSLWNVYDHSTADFMSSFYENLKQNDMNKATALRQARLNMIQGKKYSHPYYWAPFILIGKQ